MKHLPKILSISALVVLLAFMFILYAWAFDGRSGDQVVIGADEVLDDDLYVTAQEFTLVSFVRSNSITLILVGLFLRWLWGREGMARKSALTTV